MLQHTPHQGRAGHLQLDKNRVVSTVRRHASKQLTDKFDCNDVPKQAVCSNTLPIWEGQLQPALRSLRQAVTTGLTSGSCCKHWLAIQSNASGHGAVVRQPVFSIQCIKLVVVTYDYNPYIQGLLFTKCTACIFCCTGHIIRLSITVCAAMLS